MVFFCVRKGSHTLLHCLMVQLFNFGIFLKKEFGYFILLLTECVLLYLGCTMCEVWRSGKVGKWQFVKYEAIL